MLYKRVILIKPGRRPNERLVVQFMYFLEVFIG
jgi:hypothetical protein